MGLGCEDELYVSRKVFGGGEDNRGSKVVEVGSGIWDRG